MVEAWYLLIAFGLGWYVHPDYTDSVTIRDGCPVSTARLIETEKPPTLPEAENLSNLDVYMALPLYNEAVKSCNMDKSVVYKEITEYNQRIADEAESGK